MNYAINQSLPACLDIFNHNDKFPIRRVYCVGRNYAEHAQEMGSDLREPPFFFCKPNDNQAVLSAPCNQTLHLPYPLATNRLDYEVELVIALKSGGQNISPQNACEHIFGYAVGLDMTRRDLQAQMKDKKRPWEIGKVFDGCAIVGQLHAHADFDISQSRIWLSVNDKIRQNGQINQMIWQIDEIISELSKVFVLSAGDIIFTGTPAGVGCVNQGDVIDAHIDTLSNIKVVFE